MLTVRTMLRWFAFAIGIVAIWTVVVIMHYNNPVIFYHGYDIKSSSTLDFSISNTENVSNDFEEVNILNLNPVSTSSNVKKLLPFVSSNKDIEKTLSSDFLNTLYETNSNQRFLILSKEGLKYFASSKNYHQTLWSEEPYLSRRVDLRSRCSDMKRKPEVDLSRMVYDDHHKVIMCVVPKAACTTWKRYMYYLLGKETDKSKLMDVNGALLVLGTRESRLPLLQSLSTEEALKRLATYTTFMVTRHPFERMVSAHSSKFTDRSSATSSYKMVKGKKIAYRQAKVYLNGLRYFNARDRVSLLKDNAFGKLNRSNQEAALQYVNVMNTGKISFRQLIDDIIYHPVHEYETDVHWRPQVSLCNPCAVNYDFVVRFANIARDGNYLLRYLQRNDPEEKRAYFDESNSHLIDESRTAQAFADISGDNIDKLKSLYQNDFTAMGYSSDHFA